MKKHLLLILAILCAAAVFAACSAGTGADAAPANAEPAVTATPEPTPVPTPEPTPEPSPEPEFHCELDLAVSEFLAGYAQEQGSGEPAEQEMPEALYQYLLGQKITPEEIAQWGCESEYAQGYLEWYYNRSTSTPEPQIRTVTPEERAELEREAAEAAARLDEEEARDFEESQRWMEENFDLSGW